VHLSFSETLISLGFSFTDAGSLSSILLASEGADFGVRVCSTLSRSCVACAHCLYIYIARPLARRLGRPPRGPPGPSSPRRTFWSALRAPSRATRRASSATPWRPSGRWWCLLPAPARLGRTQSGSGDSATKYTSARGRGWARAGSWLPLEYHLPWALASGWSRCTMAA